MSDLLPTCPRCGDICDRDARYCQACGYPLFTANHGAKRYARDEHGKFTHHRYLTGPSASELHNRVKYRLSALTREDPEATKGKGS